MQLLKTTFLAYFVWNIFVKRTPKKHRTKKVNKKTKNEKEY